MARIAKHNKKELPIGKLVPVEINVSLETFFMHVLFFISQHASIQLAT